MKLVRKWSSDKFFTPVHKNYNDVHVSLGEITHHVSSFRKVCGLKFAKLVNRLKALPRITC